jgi:hypothetical protein
VRRSVATRFAAIVAGLAGLMILGIIAIGSQQPIIPDISPRLPGVTCPAGAETSDRSWIPDGFHTLVDPSCVAYRQTDNPHCASKTGRHCVSYEFLARFGCPSALIARIVGYDADNEQRGFDLGRARPGDGCRHQAVHVVSIEVAGGLRVEGLVAGRCLGDLLEVGDEGIRLEAGKDRSGEAGAIDRRGRGRRRSRGWHPSGRWRSR